MGVRWQTNGDVWRRADGVYVECVEGMWDAYFAHPTEPDPLVTWGESSATAAEAMTWADQWVAWQGEERVTLRRVVGEVELALRGEVSDEWGHLAQAVAALRSMASDGRHARVEGAGRSRQSLRFVACRDCETPGECEGIGECVEPEHDDAFDRWRDDGR